MVCIIVCLWNSNTQQCLQAACSVPLESLCCWKCLSRYWTCSLMNLYSLCCLLPFFQSTPVLFLQAVWSKLCMRCWEHKRPGSWWSEVDLAAQSQRLAASTVHTSHLLKEEGFVINHEVVLQKKKWWLCDKSRETHMIQLPTAAAQPQETWLMVNLTCRQLPCQSVGKFL